MEHHVRRFSYRTANHLGQSQTCLRRPHTTSSSCNRVPSLQTAEMHRSHPEPGRKALPRTPDSSRDAEKTTWVVEELTPTGIPSECRTFPMTWVLVQGSTTAFHLGCKLANHPHYWEQVSCHLDMPESWSQPWQTVNPVNLYWEPLPHTVPFFLSLQVIKREIRS